VRLTEPLVIVCCSISQFTSGSSEFTSLSTQLVGLDIITRLSGIRKENVSRQEIVTSGKSKDRGTNVARAHPYYCESCLGRANQETFRMSLPLRCDEKTAYPNVALYQLASFDRVRYHTHGGLPFSDHVKVVCGNLAKDLLRLLRRNFTGASNTASSHTRNGSLPLCQHVTSPHSHRLGHCLRRHP